MNRACPCPAGDHSTRQCEMRSATVLPPSCDRRMKEFSPVMMGSWGSTSCCSAMVWESYFSNDDIRVRPRRRRAQGRQGDAAPGGGPGAFHGSDPFQFPVSGGGLEADRPDAGPEGGFPEADRKPPGDH